MRFGLRLIAGALAVAGIIVLSMDSSNVIKDSNEWRPTASPVYVSIGAVAVSGIYNILDALLEWRRSKRREGIAVAVGEVTFPLWGTLFRHMRSRELRESFGVHVWLIPSWYSLVNRVLRRVCPNPIRRRLRTPSLWRAAQFRLAKDDDPTGVDWRRGVGALGECWRQRQTQAYVLDHHWGHAELSEGQWEALPRAQKLGFDYHQYTHIYSKYHSVLVRPIFRLRGGSNPQFLGCIAIDQLRVDGTIDLDVTEIKAEIYAATRKIATAIDKML